MINGIDINGTDVEIRVARDPDGGYRVWVNAGEGCPFRAYRVPKLHLDGLTLAEPAAEPAASNGKDRD